MEAGDIYLVEIPLSNRHEQAGLRPAIIVQALGVDKVPTILIVPLTSKLKAKDVSFDVQQGEILGMRKEEIKKKFDVSSDYLMIE